MTIYILYVDNILDTTPAVASTTETTVNDTLLKLRLLVLQKIYTKKIRRKHFIPQSGIDTPNKGLINYNNSFS